MKSIKLFGCALASLLMIFACAKQENPEVHAGFTTDKDTYSVGDYVTITNTAYAVGVQIAFCKWEITGQQVVYSMEAPASFQVTEGGTITIKQTVGVGGGVNDTYEKTITIIDDNTAPSAMFSYVDKETNGAAITSGKPIVLTDASSDSDGNIVEWKWSFDGDVIVKTDGTSFEYTFGGAGEALVISLTVKDNKGKTATHSISVNVAESATSIRKLWQKEFAAVDKSVNGASPALSPDGTKIYVTSNDYYLVGFEKEKGDQICKVNLNLGNYGKPDKFAHTPSVGANGYVYATGYKGTKECALHIINGNSIAATVSLGSVQPGTDSDYQAVYYTGSPALFTYGGASYVAVPTKNLNNSATNMNGGSAHVQIFSVNGANLSPKVGLHANSGTWGPVVAMKNGLLFASTGKNWGSRVYYPTNGSWKYNDPTLHDNNNDGNLGSTGNGSHNINMYGSYMAVSNDGKKIYILGSGASNNTTYVQCYDISPIAKTPDTVVDPLWKMTLTTDGPLSQYECNGGIVLGTDGTVYAAMPATGATAHGCIYAIAADGKSILWTHEASGNVVGAPAVGNDGSIYYNDTDNGTLVKLDAAGNRVASVRVVIDGNLKSSPTIGPDGIIYVSGKSEGVPVITAIKSPSTTAPADSWSQMGGDWTKSACKY